MYFNSGDNLIQFNRNRTDKHSEDDFQIYANRKYCFQLAYDEQVLDIKWYNLGHRDEAEPGFSGEGVQAKKWNPKAVIATN